MPDPVAPGNPHIALIGPVFPYRAGIAYCTTALASELARGADVQVITFSRQYPAFLYPGGTDIDETLRARTPPAARFDLDILNPLTWIRTGLRLRAHPPDAVVFVWWVWVWALPYLTIIKLLRPSTRVILQCHNVGDKEPARWKSLLTNAVLRRADGLIVHARTDEDDVRRRLGAASRSTVVSTFLPVHELGSEPPSRTEARSRLGLAPGPLALFFGHVRPFKGLDIALRAWPLLGLPVTLLVAGEAWWKSAEEYRGLARELGISFEDVVAAPGATMPGRDEPAGPRVLFELRFIPDSEIADYFAACDVVLAPYRSEAQSGVAMTAFHFGRPVIASAVGGLPEIVDDTNGLLVPPEDPEALARAIDSFFRSADRAVLERGAKASAARYSWAEYASTLMHLVDSRT